MTDDRRYMLFAFRIIVDFGASIAVPVVLLAMGGKRLDASYGTGPKFLIAGFLVAALMSGYMIWQKAKRYGREYETLGDRMKSK